METTKFKIYKSFLTEEGALEFQALLTKYDIQYIAEPTDPIDGEAVVGAGLHPLVNIKLLPKDFKRVDTLLRNMS